MTLTLLMMRVILLGIETLRPTIYALFNELLTAKAVSHNSSSGSLFSPGPKPTIFSHQKFMNALGFIFDQASCKKIHTKKRRDIAFHGGHYVLAAEINPSTCKSAFLWSKKKKN
jgi:hypothetical protein